LVMARTLANAGLPWLAVALGCAQPRPASWEHALAALVEAVARRGAVCVIAAPAPQAAPLAYASSLTLACTAAGWQRAHGDVTVLRRFPELRGEPVIVGGAPELRLPVIAASAAAVSAGVREGMPLRQAQQLCPAAAFVPLDIEATASLRGEICATLHRLAPAV